MNPQIQALVEAKINVFSEYFDVPSDVRPEMDVLLRRIAELGEQAQDVQEFEDLFAGEVQEEYNGIFQKLTPRARPMTDEEIAQSRAKAAELIYGTTDPVKIAGKMAAGVAMDVADTVAMELQSEAISASRRAEEEAMKEAGVFDEYKDIENAVNNLGTINHIFKRL